MVTAVLINLFILLQMLSTQGLKFQHYSSADMNLEPVFVDDSYSNIMVEKDDCPKDKNANPRIITLNTTNSYSSSYFALACTASYPITLEYMGNAPMTVTAKTFRANTNPKNETNPCYIIYITRYMYDRVMPVGNFSCRSTTLKPEKAIWKYIWLSENANHYSYSEPFVVSQMQSTFVNEPKATKIVIPCIAARETQTNHTTFLRKEDLDGNRIRLKELESEGWKTTFDPYVGFIVEFTKTKDENSTRIDGKYLCHDFSIGGYVEVFVQHADFIALPNNTNMTFDHSLQSFKCFATEEVIIKILNSTSKLQEIPEKVDPKLAQSYHDAGYFFNAQMAYGTKDPKAGGVIACVTKASGKILYEWHFDNEYICDCSWNVTDYYRRRGSRRRYPGESLPDEEFGETPVDQSDYQKSDWYYMEQPYIYGQLTCWNNKAKSIDWNLLPCINAVDCLFLKNACIKNQCPDYSRNNYYHDPYLQSNRITRHMSPGSGYLECTADGYKSVIQVNVDIDSDVSVSFGDKLPSTPELNLVAPEKHIYEGDKMLYTCAARNFETTGPVIWGVEYKDGTWNFTTYKFSVSNHHWEDRMYDSMITNQRNVAAFRFTYLTVPNKKAKKLWCFVPKWNSTDWAKASIDLQIEDAVPAENPPNCPTESTPFIVVYRNSSISGRRVRLPHLVKESDVSIYDPVEYVSLYCMAKFPVMWWKDGVNITAHRESRSNCKTSDGQVIARKLHKSTVTFAVASFNATGNYTCRSNALHQSRQTSVYIYAMSPENRTTFVNEGRHFVVQHKYDNYSADWDRWAIIPCRLNIPDAIPHLFVDHPGEKEPIRVPMQNSFLRFNSKVGFWIDVTNKIIRNQTTLFYCSDHKDGSFIGVMVTLQLIYVNSSKPGGSSTPPSIPGDGSSTKPTVIKITTIPPPSKATQKSAVVVAGQNGNTGFIITVVFLLAMCCACFGVIYHLYRKITYQERKNMPPQELDWTNAQIHTGNNVGSILEHNNFDTVSNAPTNLISDTPTPTPHHNGNSNGNGAVIFTSLTSLDNNASTDDLPSLSDSFSYKKL